ncbi:hypothetical protein PYCCODRAFT_1431921 [Trametes coccinea BRFM310]|uniref:DUF7726 domain-containing protein n=1 Tax=Trametes coccinea (strain BRFM310) TaxID=1353009 RepID=A0A1Y2IZK7_TRAC3|nr:hypothetical protein PYCCODRAFT_1431921 [Trametes coccinea BRFM310]
MIPTDIPSAIHVASPESPQTVPPKRKSEVLKPDIDLTVEPDGAPYASHCAGTENGTAVAVAEPPAKKARALDGGETSSLGAKRSKRADKPWQSWRDVVLEGEEEGEVPIYDDCNDIRRKIRHLEKQPGFKITHWLKEIGNINYNSYRRFMRATGPTGGAENGTYYAAYVYFEKVRIFEGKRKTAKRIDNEIEHPGGFPREDMTRKLFIIPA